MSVVVVEGVALPGFAFDLKSSTFVETVGRGMDDFGGVEEENSPTAGFRALFGASMVKSKWQRERRPRFHSSLQHIVRSNDGRDISWELWRKPVVELSAGTGSRGGKAKEQCSSRRPVERSRRERGRATRA